ncbi:MAG: hypothetical protein IKP95_05820 [Ruminococcus sp.]|nr:hypothetical protein [Ruminococcus sp.]
MKIKTMTLLLAAAAVLSLAGCANSDSSSSAETTTTTTTAASAAPAPAPTDGKPGGKYIFSQAFEGEKETFLSVDIDPTKLFISFEAGGKGTYSSPAGTTPLTWDDKSFTVEGGGKNEFTLEGDKLTVKDNNMTLIYIHESSYQQPDGVPEGKYAFVSAHNDGTPLDTGTGVTAENTYLEFYSDGTGNASSASGKQGFTWEKGHILYSDGTDSTYILRGTTMTVFDLQSTITLELVPGSDA